MATTARRSSPDSDHPMDPVLKRGSRGKESGVKGASGDVSIPFKVEWFKWLYTAVPPVICLSLSLHYLRNDRWQESLQWGLMGLGFTLHVLPEDVTPLGEWAQRLALVFLAAGASLYGYWVYEQFTR